MCDSGCFVCLFGVGFRVKDVMTRLTMLMHY